MVNEGEWDFFISYTQADRAWAEWIAWQLEADRHRVLIQAWDMVPGSNWTHVMQQGVRGASRTIAVLSPAYLDSVYSTAEWETAWRDDPLGEKRKLLVFRVADCERPGLLGSVVSVDLLGVSNTAARQRLAAAIRGALTGRAKPATEPDFPPEKRAEPRFPGTLPEIWNVPPRNPNFTGRSAELDRMRTALAEHPAATVHALHGMGGVGKTQSAIEYAYRYSAEYGLVWWINAEQATLIGDQFTVLAEELGLPSLTDPNAAVRAVHRTLRTRDRWLLIFDNAEEAQDIGPLLPGGSGHVLITTRRSGFRALGEVLDLDTLDRSEAVALLQRRAPDLTDAQCEALAARLADLPLALAQAAAYLDQTGCSPEEYLRLLDTRSIDLHRRGHASGHPDTVATVWSVSLDRLQSTMPAAVQLLELCAWLAPEPIPLDLFTGQSSLLPEPLSGAAADPIVWNDMVGALVDYSLARRTGDSVVVHRLIQDVTRERQRADAQDKLLDIALMLLQADLPGEVWGMPEAWPRWRALLPSVLVATEHHAGTAETGITAWLLSRAGTYLESQGQYARALALDQRALRIDEAILGPDDLRVASDLTDVATTLSALGRVTEALRLHERALRIAEASLGRDDPEVATCLNYVGRSLLELGRAEEALPLHQRALRIREAEYGPDHPYVANGLNDVGQALLDLGRASDALPLQERALRIDQAALGPDHPHVGIDLGFVGRALSSLGRRAEALSVCQRALRIHEATLGSDHPYTQRLRQHVRELLEAGDDDSACEG